MATPVVKSTNGYGTAVTVVASGGLPVDIASNGFGMPIIEVASGGIPITYAQGGGVPGPYIAPSGFRWATVEMTGRPMALNDQSLVILEKVAA